jgi:hypothetical protein
LWHEEKRCESEGRNWENLDNGDYLGRRRRKGKEEE